MSPGYCPRASAVADTMAAIITRTSRRTTLSVGILCTLFPDRVSVRSRGCFRERCQIPSSKSQAPTTPNDQIPSVKAQSQPNAKPHGIWELGVGLGFGDWAWLELGIWILGFVKDHSGGRISTVPAGGGVWRLKMATPSSAPSMPKIGKIRM